jgi:hypothetical protein
MEESIMTVIEPDFQWELKGKKLRLGTRSMHDARGDMCAMMGMET